LPNLANIIRKGKPIDMKKIAFPIYKNIPIYNDSQKQKRKMNKIWIDGKWKLSTVKKLHKGSAMWFIKGDKSNIGWIKPSILDINHYINN